MRTSLIRTLLLLTVALATGVTATRANPTGGQVTAGSATISGEGTSGLTVNQATPRVVIDWQGFSIGAGESATFIQPDASSIALNRVIGTDPSQIFGSLTSNGTVILVNRNGILFGESARVDVGGLVATTHDIDNDAFMAGGLLRFDRAGDPQASVVNKGTISIRNAGLGAFVAPHVVNDGIITANYGRVALGAGTAFTLDLYGDELISFAIGDEITQTITNADGTNAKALVENTGLISATEGRIQLTAAAARAVVNQSVNVSGIVEANSLSTTGGRIVLKGSGTVMTERSAQVTAEGHTGGEISVEGNAIHLDGRVSADGSQEAPRSVAAPNFAAAERLRSRNLDQAYEDRGTTPESTPGGKGGSLFFQGQSFVSLDGNLSASGWQGGAVEVIAARNFALNGQVNATGGGAAGGRVSIRATRETWEGSGSGIDVSGATGGSITNVTGAKFVTSANYLAVGTAGAGGRIDVTGSDMFLLSSTYNAAGLTGGGSIRLGGEYQGGKNLTADELPNARRLAANDGVKIDVSATGNHGDAGTAVIWSDDKTTFLGSVYATGGLLSGVGGLVEASSADTLIWRGAVETAINGERGGTLLLDPKNITIADAGFSQLQLILGAFSGGPLGETFLDTQDSFGYSGLSLDGARLAVGALGDDGAANSCLNCGAVYLFTFTDQSFSGGVLAGRIGHGYSGGNNVDLRATVEEDRFGWSISLDGSRLAVGARGDSGAGSINSCYGCGAVYLFTFSDASFSKGELAAQIGYGYSGGKNINIDQLINGTFFGTSVSLDGRRLAVGTSASSVFLWTFADSQFSDGQLVSRLGLDSPYPSAIDLSGMLEPGDFFGDAVSLQGNRLAVGAAFDNGALDDCHHCGAIYLFTFVDVSFSGAAIAGRIGHGYTGSGDIDLSGILDTDDVFSRYLSLDGDRIAAGSVYDDGAGNECSNCGAVYLFEFIDSNFLEGNLVARVGSGYTGGRDIDLSNLLNVGDGFGWSAALDGQSLAVGSPYDDGASNNCDECGAVYLFTFTDNNFSGGKLAGRIGSGYGAENSLDLQSGLDNGDMFGAAVSLDNGRLAIGAPRDRGAANDCLNCGAIYLLNTSDGLYSGATLLGRIGVGYTGGRNVDVRQIVEANDEFGWAVSLDGMRLAVGAQGDDGAVNGNSESGAVHLFTFSDTLFSEGALVGSIGIGYSGPQSVSLGELRPGDQFGSAVSLDALGLAVGAHNDDPPGLTGGGLGAVYLFKFSDQLFNGGTVAALLAEGASGVNDVNLAGLGVGPFFGWSVSLEGTRLAVGALFDDGVMNDCEGCGAVYLFSFADNEFSGGSLVGRIGVGYSAGIDIDLSGRLESMDFFGSSVSLDGNRLAVGAYRDTGVDGCILCGAVYLFNFADTSFSGGSLTSIIGSGYSGSKDVNLSGVIEAGDLFGWSVSLEDSRLVVGAIGDDGATPCSQCGTAYSFKFTDSVFSNGSLSGRIGAGYASGRNVNLEGALASFDYFGSAVSLDGRRLAVGAPFDDGAMNLCSGCGAVYLFTFTDTVFSGGALSARIGDGYTGGNNVDMAGALGSGGIFGSAVSLDDARLAVGVPGGGCGYGCGAVYLFTFSDLAFSGGILASRIGSGYTGINDVDLSGKLVQGDYFGFSVSLDGTRLAAGVFNEDGALNSCTDCGAVYLFTFSDMEVSGGTLTARIGHHFTGSKDVNLAGTLEDFDRFGWSVSLDGTRLAVGAHYDDGATNSCAGQVESCGAVYLFTFTDNDFSGGTLAARIGDGYVGGNNIDLAGELLSGDRFGWSVSLDGTNLVAAAGSIYRGGKVYLFRFNDAVFAGGVLADTLQSNRASVSLDDMRLAVGAPYNDGAGYGCVGCGAVYLFALGEGTLLSGNVAYADTASGDVTISPSQLTALLNAGTAVVLQASNDITVNNVIAAANPSGNGGDLTLQAGRSIFINANIFTDNGDLTLIANDLLANGVVDAYRDPGVAVITVAAGTSINAGTGTVLFDLRSGAGKTNSTGGAITLTSVTASSITAQNAAASNGDIVLASGGVLNATGTGNAVVLAASDQFLNNAGAGAITTPSGRFVIYSQDWTADTRGGLAGSNLYNRTYGANPPASLTQEGNVFVYAAQPILTVTANAASRTYGAVNPAFSASITGLVNGDSAGYAYAGAAGFSTTTTASSSVGTYVGDILPNVGSLASSVGYGFSFVGGNLTIDPAALTITASNVSKTYGQAASLSGFTTSGLLFADSVTGLSLSSLGAVNTANVGSYAINASGATGTGLSNYAISYVGGLLTVDPASLIITASNASKTYGQTASLTNFTTSGLLFSDSVTGLSLSSLGAVNTANVGSYAINASGATGTGLSNYAISYVSGLLAVNPALLTITANDASKRYGQQLSFAGTEFTTSGLLFSDVVSSVSLSSLGAPRRSAAGSYAIIPSAAIGLGLSNYMISYVDGTLTVTGGPRPWVPQPAGVDMIWPFEVEERLFCGKNGFGSLLSAGGFLPVAANDHAGSMSACGG